MSTKKFGTHLFSSDNFQNQINKLSVNNTYKINTKKSFAVPDTFDGSKIWAKYLNDVPYQSSCLSDWIFAALYVLSARLAIYTNNKYRYSFSPSKMIFNRIIEWKAFQSNLANGIPVDYIAPNQPIVVNTCIQGTLIDAWRYLSTFGVPETSCVNDASRIDRVYTPNQLFGDKFDMCPTTNDNMICHRSDGYYYVSGTISKNRSLRRGTEMDIRRDIHHWGPCTTAMKVFGDFIVIKSIML